MCMDWFWEGGFFLCFLEREVVRGVFFCSERDYD